MIFFARFLVATLEEEDAIRTLLYVLESLLFSSTMWGVWSTSPAMEWEVGATQRAVKDWKARARNDGAWRAQWHSGLYAQQMTIWWFISPGKDVFLFQPPMQSKRGIEKPKSLGV
jgi:hypothetical protein